VSGQLFKLAEGWLSSGIIASALALDGADRGLFEDLPNFWQNGFLMTIPLSPMRAKVRITAYLLDLMVSLGGLEPPTSPLSVVTGPLVTSGDGLL
jgi:hypothetical protein